MSQTTPSKVLKLSPNSSKQGPLKATIPISSVLKQTNYLRKSVSPTLSPTTNLRKSFSQDQFGRRSPGSSNIKGKSRSLGSVDDDEKNVIKRTASLDAIYLKGQWPRDNIFWIHAVLQINKATQTEDSDWLELRKSQFLGEPDGKFDNIYKPRSQRSNNQQSSSGGGQISISCQTNTCCQLPRAMNVNIPMKPLPKSNIGSSLEGLNQEVQKLVQCASLSGSQSFEQREEMDKEGHRAPLPDFFRRSRSVNTQTPTSMDYGGSRYSSSGSRSSTPDHDNGRLGTSPHKFAVRGPPDGCERVRLKSVDERRNFQFENTPQPCSFQLTPSQGSAFQILQHNLHPSKQDLPLVPSEQDLI